MKTVKVLFLSALFAACAPATEVPIGSSAGADCVTNIACAADRDCGPGTRCNTELPLPRCQRLQCGPNGSICSADAHCQSLMCANYPVGGASNVCYVPMPDIAPYQLCEGRPLGALCGPSASNNPDNSGWRCLRIPGLPGSAAQCTQNGTCPPGPNGQPASTVAVTRNGPLYCHFQCDQGTCPTGYVCADVGYTQRFCVPGPRE